MALNQTSQSPSSMKDEFVDCLSQQISEYELLKSMYPNHGEIVLSDNHIIDEINSFIEGKTEYVPGQLDFKINLLINNLKLEVFISLPRSYPKDEPDIYVRCNQFNRSTESKMNSEIMNFVKDNHDGEVCLYTAISWLQENIDNYTNSSSAQEDNDTNEIKKYEDEYTRLWVYSHHIYNKRKREEIVKKAKELKLTGFSLPGKPGIICIEGHSNDCDEWWRDIKSMTWKKIMIRKTEVFDTSQEKTYKKFSNFEELQLNMSDLAKYMNELSLSQVFQEIFGLSNDI